MFDDDRKVLVLVEWGTRIEVVEISCDTSHLLLYSNSMYKIMQSIEMEGAGEVLYVLIINRFEPVFHSFINK